MQFATEHKYFVILKTDFLKVFYNQFILFAPSKKYKKSISDLTQFFSAAWDTQQSKVKAEKLGH